VTTWGWISYDPELNRCIRLGQSLDLRTRNSVPATNKWSDDYFARNPDTGCRSGSNQIEDPMTSGDFAASPKMILSISRSRRAAPVLTHFDPATDWA